MEHQNDDAGSDHFVWRKEKIVIKTFKLKL